ncbi:MAG TPA: hypothetical protein VM305_09065 [Candidatus Limnocylindrales bacterium]|nr:hypothetical protein [Candidatus Limnocylindrales bacterium]
MSGRASVLGDDQPRSLTWAIYRHTAIMVVAALVLVALGYTMPVGEQPLVWVAAAVVLGVLAGLLSGWYGLIFLVSGLAMGTVFDLAIHRPGSDQAADQLAATGEWYLATIVVGTVAFALVRLVATRLRGR